MENKKINPTGYNIKIEPLNYYPSVFDLTEGGIIHDDITVDEELSGTSENPVQNKVITSNINTINDNIDNINNNIDNINNNLSNKQDKLTAGDNITITDNIISANIPGTPSSITVDTELSGASVNPVQNKVITNNINSINNNIDNINNNIDNININISNKQDKLTAGNNITITNNTISANIPDVPASVTVDTELSGSSENPVQNKVITNNINSINNNIDNINNNLSNKQDKLTAGDNITITGNIISASGGSGGSSDFTFEKDTNLTKENNIISTFFPSRNLLFFYINKDLIANFLSGEISNASSGIISKTIYLDLENIVLNYQKVKDFIDNINKEGLTDENTPYINTYFVVCIKSISVTSADDIKDNNRYFKNVFFYGNKLTSKSIYFSNYNYQNYEKDSNGSDKYFTVGTKKYHIVFFLKTDFSNSTPDSYLSVVANNWS